MARPKKADKLVSLPLFVSQQCIDYFKAQYKEQNPTRLRRLISQFVMSYTTRHAKGWRFLDPKSFTRVESGVLLEQNSDEKQNVISDRPKSKKGPPSNKWSDYMTDEEYDELDRLNPIAPATAVVDAEHIATLRMQIAQLQYEGKDTTERKATLADYMQHVARVRAGTHKPPPDTAWTQDFSGMDVEEPPSGWGVYIPEFGYGMIDWLWYTKEEGFPEPKTVEEVKKKLDERKRLRQDPSSRPRADFGKKKMTIFEHKP